MSAFEIRAATAADAPAIVELLASHWTAQGWSMAKHRHYYVDYPEGPPLALVAVEDGRIAAHVGLLPVRVGGVQAELVLQVLIARHHRRGGTLVELLRAAEDAGRARGSALLCGFGNIRFSKVAERFARWRIAGYLRFAEVPALDVARYADRLRFEYGEAWYRWKLGPGAGAVEVRPYEKDGVVYSQLLKTRGAPEVSAAELGLRALHVFHPELTAVEAPVEWSQPFVVQPLVPDLGPEWLDLRRWYVEMGDSDTFEPYRPWLAGG